MLNKEEYTPIELRKHCIKTMQFSSRDSNAYKEHKLILSIIDENISMKYKIAQLESNKQKLIEKLEKIKYDLEFDRRKNNYSYLYDIKEILSILKGENDEH